MNTYIIYQFVIVAIITVLSVTKAEVDCNERPPFVRPNECCEISIITDDIKEKCQEFSKPPGGPPGGMDGNNEAMPGPPGGGNGPPGINRHGHDPHHHGHHHHCFFSCVLNKTGIMIDGELQEDRLNEYLNEALDDPKTIDIVSNNFLKCSEKMQNMPERKGPPHGHGGRGGDGGHGPPHHNCPPGNGMVMACAMMKTFKECPESIWSDTKACNTVRDYWNKCHSHPGDDIDDVEEEEEEEEEKEEEEEAEEEVEGSEEEEI